MIYIDMWDQKRSNKLLSLFVTFTLVLTACADHKTVLETIHESGELRFVTIESPLTYFKSSDGTAEGLEYELASMFAQYLGLGLKLIVVGNNHDVVSLINNNKAHIGSSALVLSDYSDNTLQYGPAYITAKRQLVYHRKNRKPKAIEYLAKDKIIIGEEQSIQALLEKLHFYHPDLAWSILENKSLTEILSLVNENSVPIAIVDSNWTAIYRYLFPEVGVAFDITGELPVAWMYKRTSDRSLDKSVRNFFEKIKKNGTLEKLINRYYQHAKSFDYVDTRAFLEKIDNRLPNFIELFRKSAKETELDWLLLAAVSYQESHWDPEAKSPTGVRGLMMLTIDTAKSLGVEDRLDPEQSILGGARYLAKMINKIPEGIQNEDRIWFALAAYNVGFGHVEDARKLTQLQGGDPDKWAEVSQQLPLLEDENWHRKIVHGYARGTETVKYVKNIRRYYDILKWKNAVRVVPAINSPVL